ncbi:hypothetical protein PG993_006127 [Apiospora rasikravindrae]|uniref:Uncharacterized protein n=1 Tax=Apiospora rasikravindrae TaxID=990691 RepID=A0ABR1TAR3_9PEZI
MPTLQTMELQELERSGSNHQPCLVDSSPSPHPVDAAEGKNRRRPVAVSRPRKTSIPSPAPVLSLARLRECLEWNLADQNHVLDAAAQLYRSHQVLSTAQMKWSVMFGHDDSELGGIRVCDNVGQLIATKGVLYAIEYGLLFGPALLYLDKWFVERKGMAYRIMWAGITSQTLLALFHVALVVRGKPFGLCDPIRAHDSCTVLTTVACLGFCLRR